MVTQSWHSSAVDETSGRSSLERIAGQKGSEPEHHPDQVNLEAIVVAGDEDEADNVTPPEQPLDERDTKIPRPIVSVNGKDVEKPDEPKKPKKKPAA